MPQYEILKPEQCAEPFERWQMEKYGNVLPEFPNPFESNDNEKPIIVTDFLPENMPIDYVQ